MAGKSYQILNTTDAKAMLDALHQRVADYNDRVVITRAGSQQSCVLISQAELEGLEKAVEILSQTSDGTALRDEVLRITTGAMSLSGFPTHG